jgi:TonB family protein
MSETSTKWHAKQLEGQWVNSDFYLRSCLGGWAFTADSSNREQGRDSQSVVIKLVEENAPEANRRLESWHLASGISHPDLIRLFQIGRCRIGNTAFVFAALEPADEALSQVLPYRPLTEAETLSLLDPVLNALAHLHANGLAHGHIKPANIMACGELVKLSSDGVIRSGAAILDRAAYDPPEMAASPAGDAWSLGMTLVEILTQRLPFWDKNTDGDPVVPEALLPTPVREIVQNCLRRDPKKRWTIRDIAGRLHHIETATQASKPIVSRAARSYLFSAVLTILLIAAAVIGVEVLNRTPKAPSGQPTQVAVAKSAEGPLPKPLPAENAQPANPQMERTEPATPQQTANGDETNSSSASEAPADAKRTSNAVIHKVIPDAPQKARATIWGTVRVGIKVTVDPSGDVSDAIIASPGPSTYFAHLAQQAAQQWKFAATPGQSTDWTLRFEFSATDTKVFSARAQQ